MTTYAVVPVKPFREGKSRLGSCLKEDERHQLNELCLKNTLAVLSSVQSIDKIIVISRDPDVLAIASLANARTILEEADGGLNQALYQVNNTLDKSHDCVIVIPTDLPLLDTSDIEKLINMGREPPVVVVVADRRNNGTNVLLVNPAGSIPYRYGKNSSRKHMTAAKKRNMKTINADIPNLRIDLDLFEDLEYLKSNGCSSIFQLFNLMEDTVR